MFDWLTVAIFAGLIVLFLHRSSQKEPPRDKLWQYLIASSGCALVNYVGNAGQTILACAMAAAVLTFIIKVLKPFEW